MCDKDGEEGGMECDAKKKKQKIEDRAEQKEGETNADQKRRKKSRVPFLEQSTFFFLSFSFVIFLRSRVGWKTQLVLTHPQQLHSLFFMTT